MSSRGRKIDPETRRRVMASIRGQDTKPEMRVRQALHAAGLRFRLHRRDLPGRPDIVLPGRRLVIMVNGCFWHQHADPLCPIVKWPKGDQSYWVPKLARNVLRDAARRAELEALGWTVMTIWECEAVNPERLAHLVRHAQATARTAK
jgi:DNA mismatch endonuclease, patch repair protein